MDPKLKELQDLWYKKLKDDGFKDIETSEYFLKWPVEGQIQQNLHENRSRYNEAKQDYYRLVGYFLHDYDFKVDKEKLIWEMHAEGLSLRKISMELKKKNIFIAYTQIKEMIHKLRKLMIVKYKDFDYE